MQHLPNFGPFMKEREKKIAEFKKSDDLLAENYQPKPLRPANEPARPVPAIRAIIAAAVDRIGTYADLDNKQQVVAMIDEVAKR
jgi:dihydropyrimidine dehydrogenase (NADP+)